MLFTLYNLHLNLKLTIYILFLGMLHTVALSGNSPIKYELPAEQQVLICSRALMISEVGTKEATGKNDGEVMKYTRSVGLSFPAPYCASFIYYCFSKVTDDILKIPIPRTAVANKIYSYAKNNGEKTLTYKANIDDLIVWKYSNSWSGHIERIFEVHKAGWVLTVGANTSNGKQGSQREGNGVFIRKRNILHPLGRMNIRGLVGFKIIGKK